jgi:regulator of protease activity HflC (stomatin/prohibitin superfamily)
MGPPPLGGDRRTHTMNGGLGMATTGAANRMRLVLFPLRIVPEYRRTVVFRLGRMAGVRGPGLIWLLPFFDRVMSIDMRESFLEIPHQTSITKDNAPISIDFITFFKVVDPEASVVQVANFASAAHNIAATTLRSVVGDITLDDVLARRDDINEVLRVKLDEVTERWGVKVTNVEIREIVPPPAVQEAMTRQMSAERARRAVVTEAEGHREASVLRAEGEKQANILEAEGTRAARILRAEAEQQAAVLGFDGLARGLQLLSQSARTLDDKVLTLQYLDALQALGASPSTKIVVPAELTGLLRSFSTLAAGSTGLGAAPSADGVGAGVS